MSTIRNGHVRKQRVSPEGVVDDRESELEVMCQSVDPSVFISISVVIEDVIDSHSLHHGVYLMPPLRTFLFTRVVHDTEFDL